MKRRILFLLMGLNCFQVFAFTLLYSNPPRYKGAVEILVVNQNCNNISPTDLGHTYTAEDLQSDVNAAVNHFWNRSHSSTLRFTVRPELFDMPGNMLITEMQAATPQNKIAIGCSSNTSQFTSANILASTRMSNDVAKAVVAINNTAGSAFSNQSQEERISTIAHEIGHALGLGHTSHRDALMYYASTTDVKVRYLSPDDADGVTYLYPKKGKFIGLVGGCGMIKNIDGGNSSNEGWGLLVEGLLMVIFYLSWRKISFRRFAKFKLSR